MTYKILMDTEGVESFRKQMTQHIQMLNDRNGDLNYLVENFSQVSRSMNILRNNMCHAISEGKKIISSSNRLVSEIENARQAFIKADNDTGHGILYRGSATSTITTAINPITESLDKLNKYKSINMNIKNASAWETFWDSTTSLSDYEIFGHKIPVIPSSSDLISDALSTINNNLFFKSDLTSSMLSALILSMSGTILGSTDAIRKHVVSSVSKKGGMSYININPFCVEDSPFSKIAQISRTGAVNATRFLLGADVANTWTANSGNTIIQRVEKSGIQLVGGGISHVAGFVSGAIALSSMLEPISSRKKVYVAGSLGVDIGVSVGVTYVEDELYKLLGIK